MSATERLRAMLDERGADYRVSATGYSIDIGPYTTAYANRSDTTLDVSLRQVTPEQAIEATLGRGECEASLYKPEHGVSDCTICECGEINDISANYCNRCGRRIKVVRE